MLSGHQIRQEIAAGRIAITPYNPDNVNPNSYNVQLAPILLRVIDKELDLEKPYSVETIEMSPEGYTLLPGELYLGSTVERTKTDYFVPIYEGRSTLARYFLSSHVTAGFGDIGFDGHWTLEIEVRRPVRVKPRIKIGQIAFYLPHGEIRDLYRGKYANQAGAAGGCPGNV